MQAEPDDATLLAMLSAADIAVPDAMRSAVLAAMRALRAAARRLDGLDEPGLDPATTSHLNVPRR